MDFASPIPGFMPLGQAVGFPALLDYFAVIAGVLCGALVASNRRLDIVGTIALGLVTAYGGGIVRDLLLGADDIYFMNHPTLILLCIAVCIAIFVFRNVFNELRRTVLAMDTLSMALYALAGTDKALACGEGFVIAVILGLLTSVGGGIMRDVCLGEVPHVFRSSHFYAVSGFAGALVYAALCYLGVSQVIGAVACIATCSFLSYWSYQLGWTTAESPDIRLRSKKD